MRKSGILTLVLALSLTAGARGQQILASRGIDQRVDYASLTRFGPWDDRNYQLTFEDLAYLPANEQEFRDPIPAFFRIAMRQAKPELAEENLPYPRSALQIFRQLYTGYLVDGNFYHRLQRGEDGRLRVDLSDGVPEEEATVRFLDGDVRVTTPQGAAESAVAIHPSNRDVVIAGSNGPGAGQKMHFSTDGGEGWTPAAALPLGSTCCDPTVDWSSDGAFAYTSTLGSCADSGCNIWFYRSADNGRTWIDLGNAPGANGDPRRELTSSSNSDKEYLHVDRHAASPYKDNLYLTWHDNNVIQFAASSNFGNTWTAPPLAFSTAGSQRGIGSDVTSDKNGYVYVFWPAFNSKKVWVRRSKNGGTSFEAPVEVAGTQASFIFPIPSMDTRQVFVYVAAGADLTGGTYGGSLYAAWTDSTAPADQNSDPAATHSRVQVAYSRDAGATWTVTTPHETNDAASVDRWHPWLAVGSDGTVHVVFYDTRRALPRRAAVDLFHSKSIDGGQTWSSPERLTAQQSPKIGDDFEFGDYNGLDVSGTDLIGIYTDNRNEGGGAADSVDVYAAGVTSCTSSVDLVLESLGTDVNTTEVYEACNSITAGPDVNVVFPGNVTFRAGIAIVLRDGFSVQSGALFTAELATP